MIYELHSNISMASNSPGNGHDSIHRIDSSQPHSVAMSQDEKLDLIEDHFDQVEDVGFLLSPEDKADWVDSTAERIIANIGWETVRKRLDRS